MCVLLLQSCCVSMPVEFLYWERNGNVLEAIAWFIQQPEDSWCLSWARQTQRCKRLSKGQVHRFCPWKVPGATAHLSELAESLGFPRASASAQSRGNPGGQSRAGPTVPYSRPELRSFAHCFPAKLVCGALLFSRCWGRGWCWSG